MKISKEQKRLKAIKLKYVLFPTKCESCGEYYKREKMWQFYRYDVNQTWNKWNYCRNCMPSAEAVLHEIDTDEIIFGLAGIDDFNSFRKKDLTRMLRTLPREKAFERTTIE